MFSIRLRSKALSQLWSWSAPQRLPLLAFGFLGAFSSAASVFTSLLLKALIDYAIARQLHAFYFCCFAMAVVLLSICLADYIRARLAESIKVQLTNTTQQEVLHQLLQKEYAAIGQYHSGELSNRLFSDISIAINGILTVVPNFTLLLVQFLGAGYLLYHYAPPLIFLLLAASIVTGVFMLLLRKHLKVLHQKQQKASGQLHSALQETLQNLLLVKSMGISEQRETLVVDSQKSYQAAVIQRSRFSALTGFGMNSFFQLGGLITLVWGGVQIMKGQLSYGTLSALIQLSGQVQAPVSSLSSLFSTLFSSIASTERVEELLNLPDEPPSIVVPSEVVLDDICVQSLCFTYPKQRAEVLHDLTFTVSSGSITAVVGDSGIGKSTLFALLLGIYHPTSGSIQLQSGAHSYSPCAGTRRLFAYVPQENGLFSGTLRANLTQFNPCADDSTIWKSLEAACIAEHIRSLPLGLDTLIGEHGTGFSEGQCQRIAVARALISDAPILLLDESTSALDENTEAHLLENIAHLTNRTCLIVTHRKAALEICNQVIQLR